MTESGQKVLGRCLEVVSQGFKLRQLDLGVETEGDVYACLEGSVCAIGAIVVGKETWSDTAYDDAAEIMGTSPDYMKGIAVGFDDMDSSEVAEYLPEQTQDFFQGASDGREIFQTLNSQGIEISDGGLEF